MSVSVHHPGTKAVLAAIVIRSVLIHQAAIIVTVKMDLNSVQMEGFAKVCLFVDIVHLECAHQYTR